MKKLLLLLGLVLMSVLVNAEYTETGQGSSLNNALQYTTTEPLDSNFLDIQDNNAQSPVDVNSKFMSLELRKLKILEDTSFMWSLIGGLILLYFEVIKSLFYLFEMWLFAYFLFKFLPLMLWKLKEVLLKWVN